MELISRYLNSIRQNHARKGWVLGDDNRYYKAQPSFGIRMEGQHPDETYAEAKERIQKEMKRDMRVFGITLWAAGILIVGSVLSAGVIRYFQL